MSLRYRTSRACIVVVLLTMSGTAAGQAPPVRLRLDGSGTTTSVLVHLSADIPREPPSGLWISAHDPHIASLRDHPGASPVPPTVSEATRLPRLRSGDTVRVVVESESAFRLRLWVARLGGLSGLTLQAIEYTSISEIIQPSSEPTVDMELAPTDHDDFTFPSSCSGSAEPEGTRLLSEGPMCAYIRPSSSASEARSVLYLLLGASDDPDITAIPAVRAWARADATASTVLVVIDTRTSYGHQLSVDAEALGRWVHEMETRLGVDLSRRHRGVIGHSLGANAALAAAMARPDLFGVVAVSSPVAPDPDQCLGLDASPVIRGWLSTERRLGGRGFWSSLMAAAFGVDDVGHARWPASADVMEWSETERAALRTASLMAQVGVVEAQPWDAMLLVGSQGDHVCGLPSTIALHEAIKDRGFAHLWATTPTPHTAVDPTSAVPLTLGIHEEPVFSNERWSQLFRFAISSTSRVDANACLMREPGAPAIRCP